MIKLGKLALNGIPRVVVGFKDNVSDQTLQDIENFGLDIVELRLDQYSSFEASHVLKEVKKFRKFPSIATIRSDKEGGGWNLPESKRLELFKAVLPYVDAVDIELSSKTILNEVISSAHKLKKSIVISYHNFDKTPNLEKLNQILSEAKSLGADITKISALALSGKDIQVLGNFTILNNSKNIISIAMGAEGALSRIFFPALGSLMTYACIGKSTAPGQLDYATTMDLLRQFYPKYNQEKIQMLKLLELV